MFARLKYESGVHRVQRVPETEASGRIHTSAATVAVLPEAEEVDVEIDDKDLRIDVFRASGPGGQSVNTTDSAVRITHLPTGLVVIQQDEKSQHKNKARALKVLRARLYEMERQALAATRAADRKSQVGSGDRSRADPHLQFPARPRHRPPDQPDPLQDRQGPPGEALDEIVEALIANTRPRPAGRSWRPDRHRGGRGPIIRCCAIPLVSLSAAGIDKYRIEAPRLLLGRASGLSV